MKSNGKNLYEKDIDSISYEQILKYKFNFMAIKKDGAEIKITRKLGKTILKLMGESDEE